jgi:hypothetical protein
VKDGDADEAWQTSVMSTQPVRDAFTIQILHHIIKNEQNKVTLRKNCVHTCQSGQSADRMKRVSAAL